MKIVRLDLLAFGPFTQQTLDFSACQSDLHIVHGPNEAGKSSALRALKNWLYGIPTRTPDNFVHAYQNLRIGGILEAADGRRLECIRRKGRANTLRGPDDTEVFDEVRLASLLGGVDESTFGQRFGIDYEELRRGGQAVVRDGGDLAEVLFAAGAGVADLRAIQERLQEQAEGLFKPRGSNQAIPRALGKLKEARAVIRDAQLPTSEWVEHDEALRRAQKRQREIEAELSERWAERSRLDRIYRSLPLIGRLMQVRDELALVADAALLPDTFSGDRREAETNLANAEQVQREAEQEIKRLEEQLAGVTVPQELLEHRTAITQLHRDLGRYRKAANDRPRLVDRRKEAEKRAMEILEQLDRPAHLEAADSLKLPKHKRRRIQTLASECQALVQRQQSAQKTLRKLEDDLQEVERQIKGLPLLRDVSKLERAIRRVQKRGDLDEQRREAETELGELRQQAEVQLHQLPLFDGTLEALERLAVPAVETIEQFEKDLGECKQAVDRLGERIAEWTGERRRLKKKLDAMRREQDVPTEADLQRARERRDAGWEWVQRAWQAGSSGREALGGDGGDPAIAAFVEEFAPGGDLAAAYRASVEAADAVADRLRREADRVAKHVKLEADLREIEQKLAEGDGQLQQARERLQRKEEAWKAVWEAAGIDPLSPREMRAWRSQQQELVRLAADIRRREGDLARLSEQIDSCRSELQECMAELDLEEPPRSDDEALSRVLDRCEQLADGIRRDAQRRESIVGRKEDLSERLADARQEEDEARKALEDWQKQWAEAVAALGLEVDAKPGEANAVLEEVDELSGLTKDVRQIEERIEGIDRDAKEYEERVRRLLQQVAGDLLETLATSVEQAVADLADRLSRAEKDQERVKGWQEQIERQRAAKQKAEAEIRRSRRTLEKLCEQAGCASPEELPQAEERSKKRREIESERKQLEQKLGELAAGTAVDEWVATVETLNPDQIQAELKSLDDRISGLEEEKRTVAEAIGEHRNELSRMDGSDRAAEAQIEAEHLLAALRRDAEQYARLRLAWEVLARAMERFREASQGPVLERAGELFSELTGGSFDSLRADFDEGGDPVLVGVRPSGQVVRVEGMSDGTCDQLYLALRLALLESSLDRREPIPFIVDDILIMFDDERSVTALKALTRLSKRTQVIFFTHHQHLVDLAKGAIGAAACIHRLGV